ncbi:unnamed protein product, partial [marine sediment metagenome]
LEHLPDTMKVKTGSGGFHAYFKTTKAKSLVVNQRNTDGSLNRVYDIQATGKQVLIAGCKHPNGKQYAQINDLKPSEVGFQYFLNEVDKMCQKHGWERKENIQKRLIKDSGLTPLLVRDIKTVVDIKKYPFKISDILNSMNIPAISGQGVSNSPLHEDSANKRCFSYNDSKNIWNDYHLGQGGTIRKLLYLLKKANKLPKRISEDC